MKDTTTEEIVEVEEMDYIPEDDECNSNVGKIILGVGAIAVAGATALLIKNRNKFEARRIERLRKKGYIITEPEQIAVYDESNVEFEDEE